jgi:hypothetical protein
MRVGSLCVFSVHEKSGVAMRFESGMKVRRATARRWAVALLALSVASFGCAEADDPSTSSHEDGHERQKPSKSAEPQAPPPVVPTASSFSAVWGSSKNDVWAVGSEGSIVHYDGKQLSMIESGTKVRLLSVHGTAPDDVWFVGEMGTTLHWDGESVTEVSHILDLQLLGVWANGPDDVWAIGFYPQDRIGAVRHWTGTEWDELLVAPAASLWEIWSSGPGDVWVVGTTTNVTGLVLHARGNEITKIDFDGKPLRSVWGTNEDDVWVLPYDSPIQHWDGSEFTLTDGSEDEPMNTPMLGMWGANTDDVWAVGLEGTILHYDGGAWHHSDSGVSDTLWAIWGASSDDVWAAGGEGTLLRWHGDSWSKLEVGVPIPTDDEIDGTN